MPIYEYDCLSCGLKFEILVSLSRIGEVSCPSCKSREIKKSISAFGIGGGGNRLKTGSSGCSNCSSHNCSSCK